jgi:phosphoribosylamine--glycine ligase
MKVLVVGAGAREHALCWKLSTSPAVTQLFCLPGNAGTARLAQNLAGRADDIEVVLSAARTNQVELVVVGPEDPLVAGLVDRLREAGILAYGPDRAGARLEGSKIFSKELMREAGVPTADFRVFSDADEAEQYVRQANRPLVVKADGLAAGKGVVVAKDAQEALDAIHVIMRERAFGTAGERVLIEECLVGQEVSYHVVCDGERYVALAPAQDHKRIADGDKGPNTGGMGAYSPPPVVTAEVERKVLTHVVEPTLRLMKQRGTPFRGTLFVGLMIVDGEPMVLEYNTRFGDPETEVLMARWDGDVLPLLLGSARGDLTGVETRWAAPCALCVVMASQGYPGSYEKGVPIEGLDRVAAEAVVFHAGTSLKDGHIVTSGGRVLAVTAVGESIDQAAERAYAAVDVITFSGAQHRRDIGHHARKKS